MIFDPDSKDRRDPKLDALKNMGRDREREARENPDVQRGLEQARRGELTDGPKVDRRSGEDRRSTPAPNVPSPDHLGELMALAATVRQCQRNGHPDLPKHLEALLTKLGA